MNYNELMKLVNEFGLKREGFKLTYKDFTIATINNSLINLSTGDYRLDFISSSIRTLKYEIAQKTVVKRIAIIKEIIIHNKKVELEKDFIE